MQLSSLNHNLAGLPLKKCLPSRSFIIKGILLNFFVDSIIRIVVDAQDTEGVKKRRRFTSSCAKATDLVALCLLLVDMNAYVKEWGNSMQ